MLWLHVDDPEIDYITIGKANPGWCLKAVSHNLEEGVGLSTDEAILDLYRRRVLRIMRKLLGADRRPRCNTDRELRR